MTLSEYTYDRVEATKAGRISRPIVMASAAGYYVGAIIKPEIDDPAFGYLPYEPWDRYSDYMTEDEAWSLLQRWEKEDLL